MKLLLRSNILIFQFRDLFPRISIVFQNMLMTIFLILFMRWTYPKIKEYFDKQLFWSLFDSEWIKSTRMNSVFCTDLTGSRETKRSMGAYGIEDDGVRLRGIVCKCAYAVRSSWLHAREHTCQCNMVICSTITYSLYLVVFPIRFFYSISSVLETPF